MKLLGVLAIRFLKANRRANLVLGLTIALAVACSAVLAGLAQSIASRTDARLAQRHGDAQITFPVTGSTIGAGWIAGNQLNQVRAVLASEWTSVSPAVRARGILVSDEGFTAVTIASATDEEIADLSSGNRSESRFAGADSEVESARGGQKLLVGYAPLPEAGRPLQAAEDGVAPSTLQAGFVDLDAAGVHWVVDPESPDLVRVRANDLLRVFRTAGIAPDTALANVIVISAGSAELPNEPSSAVVAFDAAELLAGEYPDAIVRSRLDIAGRKAAVSAGNIAGLLQLALLLPVIAAVVGTVLVATESRRNDMALLGAMGFDAPAIRGLIVRETAVVAAAATAAGLVLAVLAMTISPAVSLARDTVIRSVLAGCLGPPGLAFLAVRRSFSGNLHDRIAELQQ